MDKWTQRLKRWFTPGRDILGVVVIIIIAGTSYRVFKVREVDDRAINADYRVDPSMWWILPKTGKIKTDDVTNYTMGAPKLVATSEEVKITTCHGPPATLPLFWNTWTALATDPVPTSSPSQTLEADRDYWLYLDLAALDYRVAFGQGGDAWPTDRRVRDELASGNIRFDVVLLPDEDIFDRDPGAEWEQSMQVSVDRMCSYDGSRQPPPYSLPDIDVRYRFGHVKFTLHTRRTVPPGSLASIAISIWANGRPVDDLEVHRCVGGSCAVPDPVGQPAISAMVNAGTQTAAPDVGLHVLTVGARSTWSILRLRGESVRDAVKWRVGAPASLLGAINATLHAFNGIGDQGLALVGTGLLNILFPPQQAAARIARQHFATLMHQADGPGHRPLLVAKFVPRLPLPLGLAALRDSSGQMTFLGRRFDIELPLDDATPARPNATSSCQLHWVSLRPPPADAPVDDGTLLALRDKLDGYNDRLLQLWRKPRPEASFFDIQSFGLWMGKYPASDADRTARSGLMIVSHHGTPDEIHFAPDGTDQLPPTAFARSFAPSSIAILNACGTGNPTAMGFVDRLVEEGFTSIIGTACEVTADVAADFLHCFASAVDRHSTPTTIGVLFQESLVCMRDDMHYGDRAYAYMLLGDPSALVCPIREEDLHP